jgi:antitoxin component YwqK of YwqJK toxin-antitoxin module
MSLKTYIILVLFILPVCLPAQVTDSLNKIDSNGKKQGHWIKKYPNGHIQYDGYFRDDHPTGVFKRFFETDSLLSVLVFSSDGKLAEATIYHPNGYVASKGKFVNQLKEGKWSFYSTKIEGYLVSEEEYQNNLKNGSSVKYYPDKSLAEKLNYTKDIRTGAWIQYFPNGNACLKATYVDGKLQGKYEVFFTDGKPEYIGQYKNDARDGLWYVYNPNGTLKYNLEYVAGTLKNHDFYRKESDLLDSLEKNKGKISDPEKTGTIWK